MTTYTTSGSVRGDCGHQHRSIAAALACVQRDQRGCAAQGGYSDRRIVRGDGSPLSREERDEENAIIDVDWAAR